MMILGEWRQTCCESVCLSGGNWRPLVHIHSIDDVWAYFEQTKADKPFSCQCAILCHFVFISDVRHTQTYSVSHLENSVSFPYNFFRHFMSPVTIAFAQRSSLKCRIRHFSWTHCSANQNGLFFFFFPSCSCILSLFLTASLNYHFKLIVCVCLCVWVCEGMSECVLINRRLWQSHSMGQSSCRSIHFMQCLCQLLSSSGHYHEAPYYHLTPSFPNADSKLVKGRWAALLLLLIKTHFEYIFSLWICEVTHFTD